MTTAVLDERRTPDQRSTVARRTRSWVFDLALLATCLLVGAVVMKYFVAEVYLVPSESMEPSVGVGEKILAERISYLRTDPRHGDVVVFDGTGVFDEPSPGVAMFVKRVIGVAGDRVQCCDVQGRIVRNGQPLDESGYINSKPRLADQRFDVRVPEATLWVMGDNRANSTDSRAYIGRPGGGFVPVDRVVGRAVAVTWPLTSARRIE